MRFILSEIVQPMARRIGTVVGTGLVAYGVQQDAATSIGTGIAAVIAVGIDLWLSHRERK